MFQLRWRSSPLTTSLYAAEAIARGRPLTDPALAAALRAPVERLQAFWSLNYYASLQEVWCDWFARSTEVSDLRRLAEETASRFAPRADSPPSALALQVAEILAQVQIAASEHLPQLAEQLRLREGPLRSLWEARGPGLLRQIARLVGGSWTLSQADVVLVHPLLGGGGQPLPKQQMVILEGVLFNPVPQLPEVARLAWLVSQLEPRWSAAAMAESNGTERITVAASTALALVPATLEAAQEVELAVLDLRTLQLAWQAWHLDGLAPATLAEPVLDWWTQFRAGERSFGEALIDLEQLLDRGR